MYVSHSADSSERDASANENDQSGASQTIHSLCRGFTISVTAPPGGLSYQLSETASEQNAGQLERGGSRDSDYLGPKDSSPLNRLESRLPSLENLLVDRETKKIFETSDAHKEVQEIILMGNEKMKYSALSSLVQKSYDDAEWRGACSADPSLIDTLVLFVRQRIRELIYSFQVPSDIFGRSKTIKSCHKERAESIVRKLSDFVPSSSPVQNNDSSSEQLHCAVVSIALACTTMKLLRNMCVNSLTCQAYIHEHRILDLLFDHIALIAQITYHAENKNTEKPLAQVYSDLEPAEGFLPEWAVAELHCYPKVLLQLATNLVAGNVPIQAHVLVHLFPGTLVKLFLFCENVDLILCLLHTVTVNQPDSVIYDCLIADRRSIAIWFLLLCSCMRETAPILLPGSVNAPIVAVKTDNASLGEWLLLFIFSIFKRQCENRPYLVGLFTAFLITDANSLRSIVLKLVLHSVPESSGSTCSAAILPDNANNLMLEWTKHLHSIIDEVFRRWSKPVVISFMFTVIESLVHNELMQNQQMCLVDGLCSVFIGSKECLIFWIDYFNNACGALNDLDVTDHETLSYRKSFLPVMQILATLSAFAAIVPQPSIRQQFNEILGTPLLVGVLKLLNTCREIATLNKPRWELLKLSVCRRDLLLVVANLCCKSAENQREVGVQGGIVTLLSFTYIEEDDPLMEHAAIFALRNVLEYSQNREILSRTFGCRLQRNRIMDEIEKSEAAIFVGAAATYDNYAATPKAPKAK